MVYGCPQVQLVENHWLLTVSMRAQYLRSLGYLVFVLDNRGSARRGLAFEGVIKHRMGLYEVEDQVDGVNWLVSQGFTDPTRVGMFGWSGGGYMSALCLARAPETFKVAVAGAPVTHFDGYDTHYTERYMGTPQSNPKGYEESSVMYYIEQMQGKLMLVHGLIDENVHFRHTARLINALIRARKSYDLLLFPDERHMPRKIEDRIYLEEKVCDFFVQNL
jgi:dipeptidyl-peptidase-4